MEVRVGAVARVAGSVGAELHGEYLVSAAGDDEATIAAIGRSPIQLRPRHQWLKRMNANGEVEEVDRWTIYNVVVDGQHRFAAQCEQTLDGVLLIELDL